MSSDPSGKEYNMEELEDSLEARIEEAEKLIAKMRQDKFDLRHLDWRELEEGARSYLQKLQFGDNACQKRPMKTCFCFSAQEIKHKLQFWIVHGSKSLAKENLEKTWRLQHQMPNSESNITARIEEAEKLIAKMSQDKFQITETIQQKTYDLRRLLLRLVNLNGRKEELAHAVINERKKMDLLEQLPHKLRLADNAYQKKPMKTCMSAHEMNKHKLQFRMVHGRKSLAKEKQLLKEIKVSQQQEEEDSFASFWIQWEDDLTYLSEHDLISIGRRYRNGCVHIDLYTLKQTWWLQHQMPFLISKGDTKDREGEIRELEWRMERCGVVLQKKEVKEPNTNKRTGNANPNLNQKTWTSLGAKSVLQEQVKLAGKKIEESRKSQLALGLGSKLRQVEREWVAIEKEIESLKRKLEVINQRKDEAHRCILRLGKQQP